MRVWKRNKRLVCGVRHLPGAFVVPGFSKTEFMINNESGRFTPDLPHYLPSFQLQPGHHPLQRLEKRCPGVNNCRVQRRRLDLKLQVLMWQWGSRDLWNFGDKPQDGMGLTSVKWKTVVNLFSWSFGLEQRCAIAIYLRLIGLCLLDVL